MIETHCHLDYLTDVPLEETLQKSFDAGVEKIITISVEPDNLDPVLEIANNNENVYCSQGIHPHDARLYDEACEKKIIKNTKKNKKVLAVGEIGLDYHYDNSPRDVQRTVFRRQLELAIELKKPVVIHTREAEEDTDLILSEFAPKMGPKGVVHSFTSSAQLAKRVLGLGFYLGFNGIITFKNAEDLREIVKSTPLEQILIETDSPFLTPVPHRGKKNAPFYLLHVAEKIAELKNVTREEVIRITTKNAMELFRF